MVFFYDIDPFLFLYLLFLHLYLMQYKIATDLLKSFINF